MSKIKLLTLYAVDMRQRSFITAILSATVIALLTTSCGYRLSGINNEEQLFSPLLKSVSIEGIPRYDSFRMRLKENMLSYRMKVTAPEFATTQIIIKNKEFEQQAITIGDDAKVREYLLIARVDFYIITGDKGSKKQYPMQSIQSEATYAYYPQHISISLNEKKRAINLLDQDLSSKLIAQFRILTNRISHNLSDCFICQISSLNFLES